ncbi:hypothetical protein Esi_0058_0057 [Ectocarpus siliculosus]|uniref:Uncharacterized protein n=1 Tax=Ectocarpus siliculosus TaxID=2880 RepID=D7G4S9_ECTSI|nr:hypothetical protein Esi_0058_0057 [Ectocarpus siliculosus]|eukprot:CBJ27172.1 hypothetical protein Esi_0058_0057 [Ectocarpus siliculosus]
MATRFLFFTADRTGCSAARDREEKNRPKPRKTARVDGGDVTKRSDGAAGAAAGGGGRKRPRAPSWERDYQQIWKAVTDLGSEQFTGKEKKAYEARKIVERGGRAPKDPRMPYVMLQGLRKKAKQREERREAMEAEAGVVTGNAGSARRKSAQTSRGRGGGSGGSSRGGVSERGGGSSRWVLVVCHSRGLRCPSISPVRTLGGRIEIEGYW